jgi:hypothetical protein
MRSELFQRADYFAGGSWVWLDAGALSGFPPGMWLLPAGLIGATEFGAVLRGAAPVVVPGATGAGRTAGGLPSFGVTDWAWAEAVTKIAASAIKLSDVFRISCASL